MLLTGMQLIEFICTTTVKVEQFKICLQPSIHEQL